MYGVGGGSSDNDGEFCSAAVGGGEGKRWVPVKLTFVSYPEGDWVGHILAWFSLAPVLLIAATLGVCLFRREVQIVVFLAGVVINEAINLVSKKLINQPRPCSQHDMSLQHSELGMPSSHAQFISFFCLYLSLFVTLRVPHLSSHSSYSSSSSSSHHHNNSNSNSNSGGTAATTAMSNNSASPNGNAVGGGSTGVYYPSAYSYSSACSSVSDILSYLRCWWKLTLNISFMSFAFIVSYSRVYLQYHTWAQICVGTFCGSLFALVWYVATVVLFVPRYHLIVSNRVGEFLMLRDSSLIPNVLLFEYVKARTEAQARQRKLQPDSNHCS